MSDDARREAEERMHQAGQPAEAIRAFASAYDRLVASERGLISSAELDPVENVPTHAELPAAGGQALSSVAVVKLNGGLATTMGLQQPKSLIEAREGRSFLDLIVAQVIALRRRHGVRLPLLLMNSEATREATLAALAAYPELPVDDLPADFLQAMAPKLDADTLRPARWPANPALEWAPPGHGDVYGALWRSGLVGRLLELGCEVAMISNSDNLGALPDERIAAFVLAEEIPLLVEVVEGIESDRKGGHIARRRADGRLVLREAAQTPPDEEAQFRDYRRWRHYNTNTIWVRLRALAELIEAHGGFLELPLIVNRKTVDPREPSSPPVIQLESAMGAAIGAFRGARLLRVPRTRFAPVKTTDDLLLVRSDLYRIGAGMVVEPVPDRRGRLPYIELDRRFYGLLDDLEARFPDGPPSLLEAERLVVRGDVTFGRGVVVRGAVELEADEPMRIEPGAVLGPAGVGRER